MSPRNYWHSRIQAQQWQKPNSWHRSLYSCYCCSYDYYSSDYDEKMNRLAARPHWQQPRQRPQLDGPYNWTRPPSRDDTADRDDDGERRTRSRRSKPLSSMLVAAVAVVAGACGGSGGAVFRRSTMSVPVSPDSSLRRCRYYLPLLHCPLRWTHR